MAGCCTCFDSKTSKKNSNLLFEHTLQWIISYNLHDSNDVTRVTSVYWVQLKHVAAQAEGLAFYCDSSGVPVVDSVDFVIPIYLSVWIRYYSIVDVPADMRTLCLVLLPDNVELIVVAVGVDIDCSSFLICLKFSWFSSAHFEFLLNTKNTKFSMLQFFRCQILILIIFPQNSYKKLIIDLLIYFPRFSPFSNFLSVFCQFILLQFDRLKIKQSKIY